jgi:SAM-dependent methyltransferase
MPFQSNYLHIHETAYQRLRQEGKSSWSERKDFTERADFFASILGTYIDKPNPKILVLGCGDGETSLCLAQKGYDVLGVDIAPSAIQWAAEKSSSRNIPARFQQLNVVESLGNEMQMAILDDHCLHCIVGKDRESALRNVFACLEPGGIFLVRTQCGDPPPNIGSEFLKMWDQKSRCQIHNGIAGRYFGVAENILDEIISAGFFLEKHRVFRYPNQWEMLEVVAVKK